MTVRQGICKGGPLDGKVRAHESRRLGSFEHHGGAGFYVWREPKGPEPGSWLWIVNKEKSK